MWQKLQHFFAKDDATHSPIDGSDDEPWPQTWADRQDSNRTEPSTRPLAVGLPRQATFRRQNSERRDRLLAIQPGHAERRAVSSTRHASMSLPRPRATSSPPHWDPARTSAPAVAITTRADLGADDVHLDLPLPLHSTNPNTAEDLWAAEEDRPPRPPSRTSSDDSHYPQMPLVDDKADLREELDRRWILNLSMHFRDKSDREKFFVTYAQAPNFWRRVTVSCDYRNAEPGSLEMDLKELQFQRDKSMQIYESIRDSLPEIQFYDTVTNLKLETTDGRLHVHVTEDVNEIIPYPPRNTVAHILNDEEFQPMSIKENELVFDSHLSGFVYKVQYKGQTYIKKEIPGPDTVDEFLYEINALHALHDSEHVIKLEALVLDDTESVVKGLLIGYADKGAVVDLLYDHRGSIAWEDRCKWAEQAVRGLCEIHEEGFVQGDFTLSNIVVDGNNNAKIIDINRRGCPVGWEPPEIATKIASNQRISMYIGEKSDLYQLGMTLWALAMDDDEPERHVPPLSVEEFPSEVPDWYQEVVRICLSPRPRDRLAAKELVSLFPEAFSPSAEESRPQQRPALKLRTLKKYIDPADAVERDDILRLGSNREDHQIIPYSPESSRDDYTFTYPKSSNYEFESDLSGYDRPRGRRPPSNYAHLGDGESHHWESGHAEAAPKEECEPNIVAISPGMDREFDEVEMDGHRYLISRQTFNEEELEILERRAEAETDQRDHNAANAMHEAENLINPRPIPPRRPSLLATTSATSDSTPRNSQDLLSTFAKPQYKDFIAEIDDVKYAHALAETPAARDETETNDHSSVNADPSPAKPCSRDESRNHRVITAPKLAISKPAGLPFEDSGYHEILGNFVPSEDVQLISTNLKYNNLDSKTNEAPQSSQAPEHTSDALPPSIYQSEKETEGFDPSLEKPLLVSDQELGSVKGIPVNVEETVLPEVESARDNHIAAVEPEPVSAELTDKDAAATLQLSKEEVAEASPHAIIEGVEIT